MQAKIQPRLFSSFLLNISCPTVPQLSMHTQQALYIIGYRGRLKRVRERFVFNGHTDFTHIRRIEYNIDCRDIMQMYISNTFNLKTSHLK